MLTEADALTWGRRLKSLWSIEKGRLDTIDDYLRGVHAAPYKPKFANSEFERLQQRSVSNWMPLVVSAQAQALFVEGYRQAESPANAASWASWQANGLDHRQAPVHRAALSYGLSYVQVMPGDPEPVIRGVSPRRMLAVYENPVEDDWPVFALRADGVIGSGSDRRTVFKLIDATHVYTLNGGRSGARISALEATEEHGLGDCPVARFADGLDLEGRAVGQVEPLIPIQDRINQTAFDMLLAQTYGAFKVRTISGVSLPTVADDAEELSEDEAAQMQRQQQLEFAVNRVLTAEDPDTKFGQLDETPLKGYIESLDTSVRHLAAISQTPPHHLLGQMANLSAEALAAAESGLMRRVDEHKHSFGESWEQVLRMAAHARGDSAGAGDFSAQVVWRDTESRSLAQTADALGKLSTMLGIPPQALWERIPGVTSTDVTNWKAMLADQVNPISQLNGLFDTQMAAGADDLA